MEKLEVKNPYSGQILSELNFASPSQIQDALDESVRAFHIWRRCSAWERAKFLLHAAQELQTRRDEFAILICKEAGKPIQLARIEVDRAIGVLKWASAEAQRFSGELLRLDATASGRNGFGIHTRFPRGVVLGITPFNFPLNLVMHKVAPAIACGCTIIIKPSLATPLTALKLNELFEATVPGLVQVVLANDEATEKLTQAREIATISFTGSARVGKLIRREAPEKPTTLELGGNAWVIVAEDTPPAALPGIAKRIAGAAFGYAGQSCISVQNVAVAANLWANMERELITATESTPFGDPTLLSVISGPSINSGAAERIRGLIRQTQEFEVGSIFSSKTEEGSSEYSRTTMVAPTLITLNQTPHHSQSSQLEEIRSQITQEEVFAPVMVAQQFDHLDPLVAKINSSRYGLQTGIYTSQLPVVEKLYRELEVGGLIVNDVPTTRYDHAPYGGVKDSGFGREGIAYAMEEMTDSKFLALSSFIPS